MNDVKGAASEGTRRYVSALRAESARRTRRAILDAAVSLFDAGGFAGASLQEIADLAGVARPTVTAVFGSKAAILKEAMDEALAGDDEPVPVAQRPWFRPVLDAATRGELFDAYAEVCCLIGARAAMLFEVCRRAADQGPETRAIWKTAVANRRLGAGMVAARLAEIESSAWPDGSSRRSRLIDGIWMLNDPSHYEALVTQRGWDEPSFTRWLSAHLHAAAATAQLESEAPPA